MAGSRRKGKAAAISYQEVDSDIDMQDDDRQVEASKVQTARKKARKAGKKVRQETEEAEDSVAPSLEIFLGAPLDILGEICSHLDPQDLVKLARTSKLFRSLLLSRSSRSIWLAARRSANLPQLEGLSEINYALLLSGTTCMECGSDHHSVRVTPDYILRTRHCMPCRKQLLTARGQLKQLGNTHPRAVECVPSAQVGPKPKGDQSWRTYYPKAEILEVSSTLNELQEDDDIAQDAWSSRRMATGTRTRKPKEIAEAPQSAVDAFVREKAAHAKVRTEQGELIPKTIAQNARDEWERIEAAEERAWQTLKLDLEVAEWLEDDIEWYRKNVYGYDRSWSMRVPPRLQGLLPPESSCPSSDAEAWIAVKSTVEARREQEELELRAEEAKDAAEEAKKRRGDLLRPHYDRMRVKQKGADLYTFPRFEPFKSFASVKPFWEEEDSTVDDESWEEALDDIRQEVEEYRIATRVKAITIILAANKDVPLSSLSTNPDDYPEDEYGDAFFSKLTSHFFDSYFNGEPYPECFHINTPYRAFRGGHVNETELDLSDHLDRRRVVVLEAVCSAGGLDVDTASVNDVDRLGHTFTWPDNPLSRRAHHTFSPMLLMDEVLRRCRLNARKPFPNLVFKHTPNAQASSSRMPAPSDDSSDEEDDSVVLSSDAEHVKPKKRFGKAVKRQQGGSDDSEEEVSDASDLSDDDDEASPRNRSVEKGVVFKLEDDSDGQVDEEESEEGSEEE